MQNKLNFVWRMRPIEKVYWSLADQAHKLGIPVFMKEDLVPIIGDENMIQEMPEEFNKVLEVQKSWKK